LRLVSRLVAASLLATGAVYAAALSPAAGDEGAEVASSNPLSGDPEAIAAGEKLYDKFCLQCHGEKADGHSPRWGKVGADLRKFWRGYTEFAYIVAAGRPQKRMPPWGGVLDADQISQIGAYLETLALPGAKWED
jgi:mono/diheme cytochrome c family protein